MDEMEAVRDFRSDAPVPDRVHLAGVGKRLFDEIYEAPNRRSGWKLTAVAAACAVAAAATLSVLPWKAGGQGAAASVPGAERWVYQKVRWNTWQCDTGASTRGPSEVVSFNLGSLTQPCRTEAAQPVDQEKWVRYDGGALATADESTKDPDDVDVWKGQYQHAWQMLPPQPSDALVAALPDDPEKALRAIRERSIPSRHAEARHMTEGQRDFVEVVEILAGCSRLPEAKARTIYSVLMGLPGSTRPTPVTDGAGRPAVAIGVDGSYRDYSNERNGMQVLLDPTTYSYRGVRYVAGIDYRVGGSSGPLVKKGTVVATATRIATDVVDDAGRRA
ncbi:hypothetical protein [Streptomyces sp. enrichment culture]|uniref:hypothetical protein n=1 Tax=Streptomyces sp. enrichment culture TaxID=1795815 RepID=UPI003F547E41